MNRNVTKKLLRWALDQVLPRPCLACARPIEGAGWVGLCHGCAAKLQPVPPGAPVACPRGGTAPELSLHPADRLHALWWYRPPCDAVIRGLKFRGLDYLAKDLARAGAGRFAAELVDLDAVVSVPMHWLRELGRGYDQAHLIASSLAGALALPYLRALRRASWSPRQVSSARMARWRNAQKAFRVRRVEAVQGKRLLLVDDVTTTGATLAAARTVLLKAGAISVQSLVIARTPFET